MRKKLFPDEIVAFTSENHFQKHSTSEKYIYLISILMILSFLTSQPFISLKISTQTRGIVQSSRPSIRLVSPVNGRLTHCELEENKAVLEGDTIVWIDQGKIEEKVRLIKDILSRNQLYLSDIKYFLSRGFKNIKTGAYVQKSKHFNKRLSELELEISILKKEFERNKKLHKSEVIPDAEIDRIKFKFQNAIKSKEVFVETQKSELVAEKKQLEESNREIIGELNQLNEDRNFYFLLSPIKGVISEYGGQREGSYVVVNQELATITPVDNLIVDTYVSPSDISFIRRGMRTKFQFDTYNYNQWGMGSGAVIDISTQPIVKNNQLLFKVRCSLDQTHLQLKSGHKGALKNGLTLTSRFEIAERTVLQLLYDKTDKWLNPKLIVDNSEKH